jgi:hypothetical protein
MLVLDQQDFSERHIFGGKVSIKFAKLFDLGSTILYISILHDIVRGEWHYQATYPEPYTLQNNPIKSVNPSIADRHIYI